jgi:hypothetical protein
MRTRPLVLVAAAALALLSPGRASAHDLRLILMLPPDRPTELVVEAGFDDDTPAEGAKVTVTAADGTVIAEGRTDERGVCKFERPGPGKYTVTVESAGHRDKLVFEVGEGDYFSGWRLDKTLGIALGVSGLLAASAVFWWLRVRHAR